MLGWGQLHHKLRTTSARMSQRSMSHTDADFRCSFTALQDGQSAVYHDVTSAREVARCQEPTASQALVHKLCRNASRDQGFIPMLTLLLIWGSAK